MPSKRRLYQPACPDCSSSLVFVVDSRTSPNGWRIRRRECHKCQTRWSTYEVDANTVNNIKKMNAALPHIVDLVNKLATVFDSMDVKPGDGQ